jgi:hypothetical protein
MSSREQYAPGAAAGAEVRKDGETWTLVLVRELRHPPRKVWRALTEPEQLREWAPFDADRNLEVGGRVKLSTVGAPTPQVSEMSVKRAEAPRVLSTTGAGMTCGGSGAGPTPRASRWQLIRRFISMGAAGWHICFGMLDRFLSGHPIGRIVGGDAMNGNA